MTDCNSRAERLASMIRGSRFITGACVAGMAFIINFHFGLILVASLAAADIIASLYLWALRWRLRRQARRDFKR